MDGISSFFFFFGTVDLCSPVQPPSPICHDCRHSAGVSDFEGCRGTRGCCKRGGELESLEHTIDPSYIVKFLCCLLIYLLVLAGSRLSGQGLNMEATVVDSECGEDGVSKVRDRWEAKSNGSLTPDVHQDFTAIGSKGVVGEVQ